MYGVMEFNCGVLPATVILKYFNDVKINVCLLTPRTIYPIALSRKEFKGFKAVYSEICQKYCVKIRLHLNVLDRQLSIQDNETKRLKTYLPSDLIK